MKRASWMLVLASMGLGVGGLVVLLAAGTLSADGVTATAALVSAVAWPAVVLAALLLFRGPVAEFIGDVIEATFPGGSVKRGDRSAARLSSAAATVDEPSAAEEAAPESTDQADRGAFDRALLRASIANLRDRTARMSLYDGLQIRAMNDPWGAVSESAMALIGTVQMVLLPTDAPPVLAEEQIPIELGRLGAPPNLVALIDGLLDSKRRMYAGEHRFSEEGAQDFVAAAGRADRSLSSWASKMLNNRLREMES